MTKLFLRRSGPTFTHKITGQVVENPSVLMHLCNEPECSEWGSVGYGCDWRKDVAGTWWCAEHGPERETTKGGEANNG